ncbi:unnamed protein product, partial [Ectocarpus sp. 12 AP-2014]
VCCYTLPPPGAAHHEQHVHRPRVRGQEHPLRPAAHPRRARPRGRLLPQPHLVGTQQRASRCSWAGCLPLERGHGIDRAPPHTPRPARLRHEVQQ